MRKLLVTTAPQHGESQEQWHSYCTRQKRNVFEGAKKAAKAKTHLALRWHCQEALVSCGYERSPKESQEAGSQHGQEIATEYENWQTKRGKDPAKGETVKPKATKPKAEKLKVTSVWEGSAQEVDAVWA